MTSATSVATWRLRRTVRQRWPSYVAIALLIGLLGGLAMAAVAGARRTQASFPVYLASTNPTDASMFTGFGPITHTGYTPKINQAIAKLPYVEHVEITIGFDGTLQPEQSLPSNTVPGLAPPAFEGGLNGEYSTFDRVTLVRGRLANPSNPDELEMSAVGAASFGLHLGSTLRLGFYKLSDVLSESKPKVYRSFKLKLVGIIEAGNQVVQSDDAALGSQFGVFTPALTRELEGCCAYYEYVSLKLDGGTRHVDDVSAAVSRLLHNIGPAGGVQTNGAYVAQAEETIRPEAIALGVFGSITALAALLVCIQLIARTTRRGVGDSQVLKALGAGRSTIAADLSLGVVLAVLVGVLLAIGFAVSLSPLAPIGPVRSVYPDRGIALDGLVLAVGAALLVVVLCGTALFMALRSTPRQSGSARARIARGSSVARAAARSGMSPAAVTGIRSALDPGSSANAPVRAAAFGAVLAVAILAATVTFGSSLNSLVARPPLYGWNWSYAMLAGFSGAEDLDGPVVTSLLNHDRYIEHWAGVYFEGATIDGQSVPVLAEPPDSSVNPTQLTGRPLEAASEIVLAPATIARLHKQVGDTVVANTGGSKPVTLRIVGTATLPTIGGSGSPSLEMGTGAVISTSQFSTNSLNQQGSPVVGPNAALIVIKPGVRRSLAAASLREIEGKLGSTPDGQPGGIVPVLRPAQIADYQSVSILPTLLACLLALGALSALGLTLASSVRRRRGELALLKSLGFTKRQLAASVAWQATVPAAFGVLFGIPLGIVLGRWLWTLFARGIFVVPYPTVPIATMVVTAVGAIFFANVVAAVPGRIAASTAISNALRTE